MKITKKQLRRIIKEEVLREGLQYEGLMEIMTGALQKELGAWQPEAKEEALREIQDKGFDLTEVALSALGGNDFPNNRIKEAGRPHSMRSGRTMADLDKDAKTRETDFSGGEGGVPQSKDPLESVAAVVQSVVDEGKGLFDMVPYLQSAGFKASVTTSPISMVRVETPDGMIAVLSSKLAEDPDMTVGPYAIGKMG